MGGPRHALAPALGIERAGGAQIGEVIADREERRTIGETRQE